MTIMLIDSTEACNSLSHPIPIPPHCFHFPQIFPKNYSRYSLQRTFSDFTQFVNNYYCLHMECPALPLFIQVPSPQTIHNHPRYSKISFPSQKCLPY